MLVATPGQTASYSTLHNSGTNGGSNNTTTAATSTMKKSSTSSTTSGTAKTLNNNNNNHASSSVTTKSSLISNTNSTTTHNYHSNTKNDNNVLSKLSNQNKSTALSSREIVSSSKHTATTHSLKAENSTNTASTTNTKHQSFIQTLKDSVQKALISTTGSSSSSIANKHATDSKLQNNCNNSKTSVNNVTSSSSATSHNTNKISTTTSSNTSSNSTAATQPSSSASVVRGKYFSCSLSKLHTVAPTVIHRYPEERQHASSTDSLHKEMCHFKPIRIVPKTPWKSGSKSRGNSLRFPKANLAAKKSEFVLKSNCDVNSRKKNQQQNRRQTDKIIVAADGDDNQQENKEFHRIYKPKPSLSCLSTSFNTPNHTSAFVCLIADMKNLVNLQSKNLLNSALAEESDDTIEELFTRKKQKPVKKQLPEQETTKTRGSRRTIAKTAAKEIVKQTNAKLNNISKALTAAITKAKSRRSVGRAKSKTVNMVALAAAKAKDKLQNSASIPAVASDKTKAPVSANKNTRKRKIAAEKQDKGGHQEQISTMCTSPLPAKSTSYKSVLATARKSSRLSVKEMSAPAEKRSRYSTNHIASKTSKTSSQKSRKNSTMVVSFSPPMTRSRLRHLAEQGKIVETALAGLKNRKT